MPPALELSGAQRGRLARAAIRQAAESPANQDFSRLLKIAFYAVHYGDKDLVLLLLRRTLVDFEANGDAVLWWPWETAVRSDPRFKEIVRGLKLVDYWQAEVGASSATPSATTISLAGSRGRTGFLMGSVLVRRRTFFP